jgi:serine-type D-Ala-D-Ala carboxypeptidase (penicillin-binding protein 5/6)
LRYVAAFVVLAVIAAGVFAGVQWTSSIPAPTFEPQVEADVVLPGSPPHLSWPSAGSAAVSVEGLGLVASNGGNSPQPIASIAKVMTADIILQDHPLAAGSSGPQITFSAADVATYRTDLAGNQSVIPVVAGESLSELQALEALLIPSANNIAIRLAVWDAKTESAFVTKMNATAVRLGLSSSHFTDPSGLNDNTVSTATDLIKLGQAAMANPAFASIVSMPQVTLPYAGTVYNFDYDLGRDGIVGIKTGSDAAAGGCFLFLSNETAAGKQIKVIGVVLGQQTASPITAALDEAKTLVTEVKGDLHYLQAVGSGLSVGRVVAPWTSSVEVSTVNALTVFGWSGERFDLRLEPTTDLPHTLASGYHLGTLVLEVPGHAESTPVVTDAALVGPSDSWRLER